jgi:hypothetical protein
MTPDKDELKRQARLDYDRSADIFHQIESGRISLEDFHYGWLDDHNNRIFDEGFQYAMDKVEKLIMETYSKCEEVRNTWPVGWDEYRKYDMIMHTCKQLIQKMDKLKTEDYES